MPTIDTFYSVRMRAAVGGPHEAGGRHVSGAERLVPAAEAAAAAQELLRRAADRLPTPDFIRIALEEVPGAQILHAPCPPVTTVTAPDPATARRVAARLLHRAEVEPEVVEAAFAGITGGLGPGRTTLRGAALMDGQSGARLEPDPARGVRVSRVDYSPEGAQTVREVLARHGLAHFRTREALAVAAKVLWAAVQAELCWSDDPDYPAGYVATRAAGYVRFPAFKPPGAAGGRIFFVSGGAGDYLPLVRSLERQPVLIDAPVVIRPDLSPETYLASLEAVL